MDLLSPKFHVVLTPGKSYTGGKTFFQENRDLIFTIPNAEVYHHKYNQLTECPQSLIAAMQLFLIGTAVTINILNKERCLSMMVHADRELDASKTFHNWVKKLIDRWAERLKLPDGDPSKLELISEFEENYREALIRIENPPRFERVMEEVVQVILDTNVELVVQGSKEIDWSNASSHILIGADMLNRGYTVEGLAVSYMPRYSVGKSNADTIQQRCRFFGYKQNYLDSCRVFLPQDSILEYCDYIEHEEIMRNQLKKKTLRELEQLLILDSSMNPTRNNILSVNLVKHKLNGWRQLNALHYIEENTIFVKSFLAKHSFKSYHNYKTDDRNHRYEKMDIKDAIEFLKDFKIANMPDALRKSSTIQYMRYLADKKDVNHAYIFEMSYKVIGGRKRKLVYQNGKAKINNIFSGYTTAYPGDKEIKFEDSICIQIHKIKLEDDSYWNNKIIYTLGIYYPENFAHSFVGIEK
ncbi:MAG: hypothetical protein RLZZ628_4275 [Bacteroidota bacterium]|jgi:hypothetical protein